MHPNRAYHTASEAQNLAFARDRAFGILAVNGTYGPLLSHVPFLVEDGLAWLHLVRSNPIARCLTEPLPACIAVSGPDGYISPDWYGAEDQVPTWNYVAVHLRGMLESREPDELRSVLDRESAFFEQRLLPKTPWHADKMTPEVMASMMRSIIPCVLRLENVQGTWKLNQNKPDEVRLRAADHVESGGIGLDLGTLAGLMREA